MPVAGIGSRFVALLVDYLIWGLAFTAFIFLVLLVDPSLSRFSKLGEKWATAVFILIFFLWYWGYFTLFEAFWSGRTPGKWLVKIRVIQRTGRGIGLFEAMTRNLLRIVDQFPGIYAVGVISVFVTRQHQRLGDLAAGTLVIHEEQQLETSNSSAARSLTAGVFEQQTIPELRPTRLSLSGEYLQRLDAADLEVLEGFFARRLDFNQETRERLALRIAAAIAAKTGVSPPAGVSTETYLEEVALQLRDIARLR